MKIVNRSKVEQTFNGITIAAGASYTGDPLDHDHDGRKGGSLPATEAPTAVKDLRAEYRDLTGKDADRRWGEDRLRAEIDKALSE